MANKISVDTTALEAARKAIIDYQTAQCGAIQEYIATIKSLNSGWSDAHYDSLLESANAINAFADSIQNETESLVATIDKKLALIASRPTM